VSSAADPSKDPSPWGPHQPKFERLEYAGPRRFYLVGRLASGEPIRVRLTSARYEQLPPK
jgi:hypothetical protein